MNTACLGQTALFLSTDARDHAEAANLCATCPVLTWCREKTKAALRASPGGVDGTWAGDLYRDGRLISNKASIGECPDCGAQDGKPCQSARGKVIGQPHLSRVQGRPSCGICGTEFKPTRRRFRYCSEGCSAEGYRRRSERNNARRSSRAGEWTARRAS